MHTESEVEGGFLVEKQLKIFTNTIK